MKKYICITIGSIFLLIVVAICVFDFKSINKEVQVGEIYEHPKIKLLWIDISNNFKENEKSFIDINKVGEYTIKYKLNGCGLIYKSVKVKVVDKIAPELTLKGTENYTLLGELNEYEELGYTAIDNYDGDIADKVQRKAVKLGNNKYEITYKVSDSSGNEAEAKRKVEVSKGIVYLTFDDGPSIENTTQILDILKEKNAKATFFVINYSEDKENIIKREYDEGHTIGLHGYSHDYNQIYTSIDNIMNNFYSIREKVSNTLNGYTSKYIRFPGEGSNTISKNYCPGIMSEATQRVLNEGFYYYDWNVDVDDAGRARTSEEIYQNFVNGVKAKRENIVLLHDSAGHKATADAVGAIVDYGLQMGFEFRNITDDTKRIMHKVNN